MSIMNSFVNDILKRIGAEVQPVSLATFSSLQSWHLCHVLEVSSPSSDSSSGPPPLYSQHADLNPSNFCHWSIQNDQSAPGNSKSTLNGLPSRGNANTAFTTVLINIKLLISLINEIFYPIIKRSQQLFICLFVFRRHNLPLLDNQHNTIELTFNIYIYTYSGTSVSSAPLLTCYLHNTPESIFIEDFSLI